MRKFGIIASSIQQASVDYVLDYPGAGVAYSVSRKLRSDYAGSAIRVRRLSDNTEQDIGFDGAGNLDESTLTSFVGANNAAVVTIYDQSGNGRDLTASGTANRIVVSGTVQKQDGRPCVVMNNNNFLRSMPVTALLNASGHFHSIVVAKLIDGATLFGDVGENFDFQPGDTYSLMILNGYNSVLESFEPITFANRYIFENIRTSTYWRMYFNNTDVSALVGFVSFPSGTLTGWGLRGINVGNIQEAIFWPSDQSANRSGIYTNVAEYYQ